MPHSDADERRIYQRRYHAANRDRRVARINRYSRSRRAAAYGMTAAEVAAAVAAQGGLCAICRLPPSGKCKMERVLHVDHDHETGAFRAMLCAGCNLAIGRLMDDAALCRVAAEYLEKHGAKPKLRKPRAPMIETPTLFKEHQ